MSPRAQDAYISLRSVLSASRPLCLCCPFKRKRREVANRRFSPMFAAFLLELRPYCSCGEGEVSWLSSPSRSGRISVLGVGSFCKRRDSRAESESSYGKSEQRGCGDVRFQRRQIVGNVAGLPGGEECEIKVVWGLEGGSR